MPGPLVEQGSSIQYANFYQNALMGQNQGPMIEQQGPNVVEQGEIVHMEEVRSGPRIGPDWLSDCLRAHFFTPCPVHAPGSNYLHKTDRNKFCLDCKGGGLCALCLEEGTHAGHRVLQVRRASHHDAVRVADVHNMLDLSHIQRYSINNATIVFINGRPPPQPFKGGYQFCQVCGRLLLDACYRLCSIGCKLTAICGAVKDPSLSLSPTPQQVVAQGLEDRPEARKAMQRKQKSESPTAVKKANNKIKKRDKPRASSQGLAVVRGHSFVGKGSSLKDVRVRGALKELLPLLGFDVSLPIEDQLRGLQVLLKRPLRVTHPKDSPNDCPLSPLNRPTSDTDDLGWTSANGSYDYSSFCSQSSSEGRGDSRSKLERGNEDKEWYPEYGSRMQTLAAA